MLRPKVFSPETRQRLIGTATIAFAAGALLSGLAGVFWATGNPGRIYVKGVTTERLKDVESGDAPEVVAETVKAATAAVPRRRYAAGRLARQVRIMRRLVPESAFDKSLRKHNHLPI